MTSKEVDRFFEILSLELQCPAEVIVTGAAAGSLMGHIRPSVDIDFEIRLLSQETASMEEAIEKTVKKTGIAAQYSQNIDRWNPVSFLDYRDTATAYKTFGDLTVKLIAPAYWTIGKMTRYVPSDIGDMRIIIRKHQLRWQDLAEIWGKALRSSMLSDGCREFRNNVTDFFRDYGNKIWKTDFESEHAIAFFKKAAQIDDKK